MVKIHEGILYQGDKMLGVFSDGDIATIPTPERDQGYVSFSCSEGEHERCHFGPERERHDPDCAPRCTCDHHYAFTVSMG